MTEEEKKGYIESGRACLRRPWNILDSIESDQKRGMPLPPQEKALPPDSVITDLPDPAVLPDPGVNFLSVIRSRKSRRSFSADALSLSELSFLLYSCQGVREAHGKYSFRTVPSGGARHPLETYFYAKRVMGLAEGLYRYLPLSHKAVLISSAGSPGVSQKCLEEALNGQGWDAAVTCVWTALPYRTEWRYSAVSHKIIAIDAGHACQNLYLACEAVSCGTCAIAAYDQEKLDAFLGVDGEDEFALYAAPLGRK